MTYRPVHTVSILKRNKFIIVSFRFLFRLVLLDFVRFAMFRLVPTCFVRNAKIQKELMFERENLLADSRTGTLLATRHTSERANKEREGAE